FLNTTYSHVEKFIYSGYFIFLQRFLRLVEDVHCRGNFLQGHLFLLIIWVISRKEGAKMRTTGHGHLVGINVKPP
ncbi:TPA: hypothetical protein ACKP8F_002167, partial [Enterococcus faecium]